MVLECIAVMFHCYLRALHTSLIPVMYRSHVPHM